MNDGAGKVVGLLGFIGVIVLLNVVLLLQTFGVDIPGLG